MDFKTLSKNLLQIKKDRALNSKDWPKDIILNSNILDNIKYIEKLTTPTGLMASQKGTSGWEYAFTVAYVIDELYFSKTKSGNYHSVIPEMGMKIEPVVNNQKESVTFNISIGEKVSKSKEYKLKNFNKDFLWGITMVMHTHPRVYFEDKSFVHTFFSPADFNFLSSTNINTLGMVTKNAVWLAAKKESFINVPQDVLENLYFLEKEGNFDQMLNLVKTNLDDCGVIFYYGKFGDKLKRIN